MTSTEGAARSAFVTGLAWFLLIASALGVVSGLMQVLTLGMTVSDVTVAAHMAGVQITADMLNWLRIMGPMSLITSVLMLYVSCGLLRRRNWARVTCIVLLAASGICYVLGAVAVGIGLLGATAVPPPMAAIFSTMMTTMLVLLLVLAAIHFWLVHRLRTSAVKAEFGIAP